MQFTEGQIIIPYLTAYLAHARQKGCSKLIAVLEELIEETKKELK